MKSSGCCLMLCSWIRLRLHVIYCSTLRWSIIVASIVFINQVSCCMPTQPTPPPTTTTPSSSVCCGNLNQTISDQFADGVMNFTYNNPACHTQATMTCFNPVPQINLTAAIVLNNNTFLAQGLNQVSAQATCNANRAWTVTGNSSQTIVIQNLFCIVADTSTPGRK
ncbi:hypothetical protein QR680_002564 [Steinernema hermaphroditum]|uniref:C6 domain-containing protein n=1 Tax=Steinernema hermaphroditum TaxID=289476 RepID=A0AA39LHX8_9BILA|nr:hypothetical protein QR680_002564 [Steinernema hermaphroditum]